MGTYKLEHGMGHVLERTQVHALVGAELAVAHVTVILDNLADVLRRKGLLPGVDNGRLARGAEAARLEGDPLARLEVELLLVHRWRRLRR